MGVDHPGPQNLVALRPQWCFANFVEIDAYIPFVLHNFVWDSIYPSKKGG